MLEEGLESLVEYLLNLFYRKQYYSDDDFNTMKVRAFFWVSVTLFKLKRYEESLEIIRSYYRNWIDPNNHYKEMYVQQIVNEMFEADPSLSQKYVGKIIPKNVIP